ncbi:DNA repair protein Rad51 [Musa troglodytarum]|uniref:DNA repair protein RAD51 homolog 3 n=1 Tax=Musa troglodytarum TaxID=320322 RepID=A0A9E7G420_9LILI|nr:DNA repair protein Rad51 [Musa troglodytarum]
MVWFDTSDPWNSTKRPAAGDRRPATEILRLVLLGTPCPRPVDSGVWKTVMELSREPKLLGICFQRSKCRNILPQVARNSMPYSEVEYIAKKLLKLEEFRELVKHNSVNVQIPVECGGLGGKAVYIDTEGSFMVERAHQIAEGCISDLLDNTAHRLKDFPACPERLQPNSFLANIFYFRICSYTEQIATINYLEKFLEEQKDVKIIVVDSITFHFRQDFDDLALRTRVLGGMSLKLMRFAKKYSLAVVLLNQVTTKFVEGSFHLTLALGDTWSHACTNRIILYWNGNDRHAYIDKSPSLRSATTPFLITGKGIRNATSHCKRVRMM